MKLFKRYWFYFLVSAVFLVPGIYALIAWGLKPGIDFTGGALIEIKFENHPAEFTIKTVGKKLDGVMPIDRLQTSGENQYLIKTKPIDNTTKDQVLELIKKDWGEVKVLRFETIGPTLSRELLIKTLTAVLIVAFIITGYVWRQFGELKYGVSAILAMFHDSLILLGSFAFLGHFYNVEVDVLFVTALLTTLSFSVHDTIVVFDRIRELKRKHGRLPLKTLADAAVLETFSRSINNSVTIIIMLTALFLLGGETIRYFALALLIGAITGTYSSPFVAVPLLLLWENASKLTKNLKLKIKN